jgi:hypothetical protein
VSAILIGFSLAAIGELASLNTYASTKLMHKVDGQIGCSRTIRRICEDVRQARMLGNIYGISNQNSYPDIGNSADPSNTPPIGGWPASPWPQPPYQLGPRTLIIQQPVLFQDPNNPQNPLNGFPLTLPQGSIASGTPGVPPYSMEYVDTLVYQLIPDSSTAGQYILQVARFSGNPAISGTTLRTPLNPPQTVLTGIVGPMDPADPNGPSIFQYLNTSIGNSVIKNPSGGSSLGVSVNIEAQVPSTNQGVNLEITSAHAESYIRASRNLRLTND